MASIIRLFNLREKQKDYSDILLTIQIYNKEKIMDVNTSIKQPRLEDSNFFLKIINKEGKKEILDKTILTNGSIKY
jgi:sulfur relay (sulfurtransferase) DsrF/TusC family protein